MTPTRVASPAVALRDLSPEDALSPYTNGPWDEHRAAHLLRRALGGCHRSESERLAQLSPEVAVDALFAPADPIQEAGLAAVGRTLARGGDREHLAGWWLMKSVQERRATGSRLALFLHDHFACALSKTEDLQAMLAQHQLFLDEGGGSFPALLRSVVRGPAMLRFLDGDKNRRGTPNENLARELLELFTLGVGHYSETDVREAARALTGYGLRQGRFAFIAAHHDPEPKHVLGHEIDNGDDLCRVAAASPRCARFLAGKFWRWYVSPTPPPATLELLAERWRATGMDVSWLLKTLLASRAFYSDDVRRSLVKSPVDLVVGTLRATGGKPDYVAAARSCDPMGQTLFEPPGVQGWADGEAWIHPSAWIARTRFAANHCQELDQDALRALFEDPGLFGPTTVSGDDARRRSLEVVGLGDLPDRADALARALDGSPRGDDDLRDLLHATLCLPEAHLS